MSNLVPAPVIDTWLSGQLVTSDWLNRNIRDAQKFLAYAPLTIVTRTASSTIASGTQFTVTYDTEVIDTDGMFSAPSTNLVAQRPGVYAIQFESIVGGSTAGTIRAAHIGINGTWVASSNNAPCSSPTCLDCSAIVALNTGDIITSQMYQDSGVSLGWGGSYNAPRLACRLISTAALTVDYGTGATSNPAPPPSKAPTGSTPSNYTKTYYATWSRTFDGDNTITWDDSAHCYQGYYDGNRGNTRSLAGFNYSAIQSDLSGATNIHVKATFKVEHSYWNSGLTAVVGTHNYASKPSTWADANVNQNLKQLTSCAAGQVHTVDFGQNTATSNSFKSWAKGIAFGPGPSTSNTYYGYMYGATEGGRPYLTITYTKLGSYG